MLLGFEGDGRFCQQYCQKFTYVNCANLETIHNLDQLSKKIENSTIAFF